MTKEQEEKIEKVLLEVYNFGHTRGERGFGHIKAIQMIKKILKGTSYQNPQYGG